MSHSSASDIQTSDLVKAQQISDKIWRQGSIFDPRGVFPEIPISDGELLIICTQSCSLVSIRFSVDPYAEAMAVRPLIGYNPRSEIARGKNQRKLQLELIDRTSYECVECDINKRYFFDRNKLIEMCPSTEFNLKEGESDKFAGWMGRYYTERDSRIGLSAVPKPRGSIIVSCPPYF